jgi:hypothetical protein
MNRRLAGGLAVVITLVLLATVLGVAVAIFGAGTSAAAGPTATLTVFTGSAQIQKAGSKTAGAAHTGQPVANGDSIATAANSKAAVTYPDGSVTRLDSSSRITVSLARSGSALKLSVSQTAGLTWNTVKKLVAGAKFEVSGPNNAVAGVRGTRFGFYIEADAAGRTVVWIDVYDGTVAVSGASGPAVTATANQRVNVRAGTPPTAPVAIPDSDRHLSFTVFNQTLEAVTGKPVAFANGTLSSGQGAGPFTYVADGKSDLEFDLGWPGSIFELTVIDPLGKTYGQPAATRTPIVVTVPRAAAGAWQFRVRDVQSVPLEPWWVVVARA